MVQNRPSRLAAVCLADIVGYSDLSGRDEELAHRVLREFQRIARLHCQAEGGRVVKLMGDEVITVFHSVDGALRAAIAVRDGFLASDEAKRAGVSLRVGLHSGEVVDGADGDVYGKAVNAASRIRTIAQPGQVVVSQVAYLTIQQRTALETDDLGEFELQGLKDPIRLYAVRLLDRGKTSGMRELLQKAIGPLQLLDVEGTGGMGEVYLARDAGLRRTLAVKVLKSELTCDARARVRFQREATVIAGLSHPNVITIHSVGELEDGTPYFVMDYIEGGSLADRLEREGPLSVREARRIIGEVSSALRAAHAKGIVHRDIKPANILWDLESGRALVTDWGIAALNPTMDLSPETRLTRPGAVIGSPKYMSPEQLAGDEVGPETDMYGLGLLAFELLTAQGPFPAQTPRELMISHLRESPPSLSSLRDEVDPDFDATIARCLAKSPRERPTAEAIALRFAPGTDSLLEWPPPGLDGLWGQIKRCALALGMGTWAVLITLLILLFADRIPWDGFLVDPAGFGPVVWLIPLTVISLAACIYLVTGLWSLLLIGMRTSRAIGLGYGWMTILETLADPRRDTGLLIAGNREYAVLTERERARLRRGRVLASLSFLLAALLPLILLPKFLTLSTGAGEGLRRALSLSFLPTAVLMLGGAAWEGWWGWRLWRPRRAFSRGRKRPASLKALVHPWYQVFEVARGGTPPGRGSERRAWAAPLTSVALAGVFGLGVVLVGMPLFLAAGTQARAVPPTLTVFDASARELFQHIDRVRWLRPPLDPSAGAGEAGQIVRAMLEMDTRGSWTTERAPDSSIEGSRLLAQSPLPPPFRLNTDSLMVITLRGLSPQERAYLAGFAGDPRLPLFERLAELPLYDATWPGVLGAGEGFWLLPTARYFPLREVAYSNLARAALAAAKGDYEGAERFLKQNLSVGLLLTDNTISTSNAYSGSVIGFTGAGRLLDLYLARGAHDLASQMQRSWRPGKGEAEATGEPVLLQGQAGEDGRDSVLGIISDSKELRSLRWELLSRLPLFFSCASLEWILWGPPPEFARFLDEIRPQLVRYPGEDALFRAIVEDVDRISMLFRGEADWPGVRPRVGGQRDEAVLRAIEEQVDRMRRERDRPGLRRRLTLSGARLGELAARLAGNPRLGACAWSLANPGLNSRRW